MPDTTAQPKSNRTIVVLIVLIGLFAGGAWFFSRVYFYATGGGIVDLSDFQQQNAQSQLENAAENITTVDNTFVNNYANDPSRGADEPELTIVAFEDFQCPFCARQYPILKRVMARYDDRVRLVYRDFPLTSIHPDAQKAAEAGQCAHEQGKFWAYHDLLFTNQRDLSTQNLKVLAQRVGVEQTLFDNCLDTGKYEEEVQADFQDGLQAGVLGTPTLFFNGNRVASVVTEEGLIEIIDLFLE